MAENATDISELDETSPTNANFGYEVDDEVRLLKNVLKLQFPGAGGAGFVGAISATEAELNYSSGVIAPIQTQLDVAINQRIATQPSAVAGNIAIFDSSGGVIDSNVSLQSILDRLAALEG